MSKDSPNPEETDPTKGMSWHEKKRYVKAQLRKDRQAGIAAAEEAGEVERAEELREESLKRSKERAEAKKAGKDLKAQIKEKIPSTGARKWADNDTARAVRMGKNAPGLRLASKTRWNMQPGEMVRLVNKAEAWTESYMVKTLGKGSIGILLDPPTGNRAAVMFGADVFTIECKKLRPLREDD